MLTKDIRAKAPGWDIWRDGYVFLMHRFYHKQELMRPRCPDGETPGESPQQMSDRVDKVIAKIRAIHQQVMSIPPESLRHD